MHSFSFNTVDLSTYGLVVNSADINSTRRELSLIQLQNRAYSFTPKSPPRVISLRYTVTGTSRANLVSNLDTIKKTLSATVEKVLALDSLTDRYFNAILESFIGEYRSLLVYEGTLVLVCADPLAYDVDEASNDHPINADPKTISEVTEGTGDIMPVYTLTAGSNLTDATIKVENLNTEEELIWVGSLTTGQELEIDVAAWIVKKEGVASMATVSGVFPRLLPTANNQIKVTGFLTTGSLNIAYRNRYL